MEQKYIISERSYKETISEVRSVRTFIEQQYKEVSVRPHEAAALLEAGKKVYQREVENSRGGKFMAYFIHVSLADLIKIAK